MNKKNLKLNIIASILLRIITIICGFVLQKFIIKYYGSDMNGILVSINQYIKYIIILEAGISVVVRTALYKPIAKKDNSTIKKILKSCDKYFKKVSYAFIIYILFLCIFIPNVVITNYDNLLTISLIIVIAISMFFDYFIGMTYNIFLQAKQKSYVVSNVNIATILINFVICIVLIMFNVSIIYIKLVTSLIYAIRPILLKVYVEKKYNLVFKDEDGKYKIDQMWNGFANHASYVVHNNTDVILLSFFSTIQEISVYSIYYLIINNIKSFIVSLKGGVDAYLGNIIAKKNKKELSNSFSIYENVFLTITTILFCVTFVMIIPFVSIYMKDINDAEYVRPLFASLMVVAFYAFTVKQPYKDLIESSGHFKQTQKGAIIEALLNISLSLVLVNKYGIVGVAIGTLVSIIIRTTELIIHSYVVILKDSYTKVIKRIISLVIEFTIIVLIFNMIIVFNINNYIDWILSSLIVFGISSIIVLIINYIFYSKEFKMLYKMLFIKK